ncbi:MAG TPA: hypothetical protein PLS03_13395 [Terrimicrobiaceae bacterium]|nr:hypothetical protein [Terrimicrobiaceae bacterium]
MKRSLPVVAYEPNILRNPFAWMGIWTPQGWRTHRKRFGRAQQERVFLRMNPGQTYFPGALRHPSTGQVEWMDDLHLTDDPHTDGGIYPCDPRVIDPAGAPRWSVSHSLLCFPVADHSLFTHEYTWDISTGDLTTHFRRPCLLEEARTDRHDGKTVLVRHAPISQTIEGNVAYDVPNSAVRGVWLNPERTGPNLYARSAVQKLRMLNGTYLVTPHRPVLQCHGVWAVLPGDQIDDLFDEASGCCRCHEELRKRTGIDLSEPKLAMFLPESHQVYSALYGTELGMLTDHRVIIDQSRVEAVRLRLGTSFDSSLAGYAGGYPGLDSSGGYFPELDFNGNGVIDEDDLRTVEGSLGRTLRSNLYVHSYFGPDWLSICVALDSEQQPGKEVVAAYEYGAGYDARNGVISIFETPGPGVPVWVDYYSDRPDESVQGEIQVVTYREDS